MRKVLICSLIFLVFILATTVPCALCAQPPVSPWPPEPEWQPMPPEEARPNYRRISIVSSGERWLTAGESFYLWYAWYFMPTNVMYNIDTREQATNPLCLQDRTDQANCIWTVKMDGKPLKPTGRFTGTCKWYRFYYDTWYIVPRAIWREYYIEFPQGLAEGTYIIELYGKPCWAEPFSRTVTLHVAD